MQGTSASTACLTPPCAFRERFEARVQVHFVQQLALATVRLMSLPRLRFDLEIDLLARIHRVRPLVYFEKPRGFYEIT